MTYNVEEKDPMVMFRYGLRAPDTKRQYPRRFQYFLDYLKIQGTPDDQAKQAVRVRISLFGFLKNFIKMPSL